MLRDMIGLVVFARVSVALASCQPRRQRINVPVERGSDEALVSGP